MLVTVIELTLFTVAIIGGLVVATSGQDYDGPDGTTYWHGYVLYPVKEWLRGHLPIWLSKPMITCHVCMSSFWGLVVSTIYATLGLGLPILQHIFATVISIFLSVVIVDFWYTVRHKKRIEVHLQHKINKQNLTDLY